MTRLQKQRSLHFAIFCTLTLLCSMSKALEVKGITTNTQLRIAAPGDGKCGVIKSWQGEFGDIDGAMRNVAHRGLDIVALKGTPVIAAAPGKVIYKDKQFEGGNSLLIQHPFDEFGNNVISYYVHMDSFTNVELGQIVSRGQEIGKLGDTGNSMPRSKTPHLHFEVLIYPEEPLRFVFGWLRGFTTVSPNYFTFPLPAVDALNKNNTKTSFPVWHNDIDYKDKVEPLKFTGFTFPIACTL